MLAVGVFAGLLERMPAVRLGAIPKP